MKTRLALPLWVVAAGPEIGAALSFEIFGSPLLQVRLKTADPRWRALLGLMALYATKPGARLDGIFEQDIDLVPRHMRRAVYVFNCCRFE